MLLPWFCISRWYHQVQMPSWILSGWQRGSNLSPWRTPADGFTPTRLSRSALVTAVTRCESVFWCEICKSIITPHRLSTVQCPAHEVRYDSSGVILSPGWPESYPNLQMCSWSVTVEKGYNVTITFENFHTEREFDVLEIFDGKNHTSSMTGMQDAQMPKTPGACVFITDLFVTGFIRWCQTSFELFPISLRSNSQQPHFGNPERWPAHAL